MKCVVLGCDSEYRVKGCTASFHGFPTDKNLLRAWIAATGRSDFIPKSMSKICSLHFLESDYLNRVHLKPSAIPTQLLPHSQDNLSYEAESGFKSNATKIESPVTCILNQSTRVNEVAVRNMSSFEPSTSHPLLGFESNMVVATTSASWIGSRNNQNGVFVNYNKTNSPNLGTNHYIPLQINMPFQLLPVQRVQMVNKPLPVQTTNSTLESAQNIHNSTENSRCGIKMVDMKKLLQPQVGKKEGVDASSYTMTERETVQTNEKKNTISHKNIVTKRLIPEDPSKVSVFHVLQCLKVILPGSFDLSRLISNEKITTLIIRYLKLDDNRTTQTIVKVNLDIIIDAVKVKRKVYSGDLVKHPYTRIRNNDLQLALSKVLPKNCTMDDMSNDILDCLCVVLSQDIFTDGYSILRKRILTLLQQNKSKISNEEGISEKINRSTKTKIILKKNENDNDDIDIIHRAVPKKMSSNRNENHLNTQIINRANETRDKTSQLENCLESKGRKSNNVINTVENYNGAEEDVEKPRLAVSKRRSYYVDGYINDDHKKDPTYKPKKDNLKSPPPTTKGALKRKYPKFIPMQTSRETKEAVKRIKLDNIKTVQCELKSITLKRILKFMKLKRCTAKNILNDFWQLFSLCRFLKVRSVYFNLRKIKRLLCMICDNKLNSNNKQKIPKHIQTLSNKLLAKKKNNAKLKLKIAIPHQNKNYSKLELKPAKKIVNKNDIKLKLKPVVVVKNITDYSKDQMLFMRNLNKLNKSNGYYSTRVPSCFQQNDLLLQKYTFEDVRKQTDESYKVFRKIITKRIGCQVVFRLKYQTLSPGTAVFLKDYQNKNSGWLKGAVVKIEGPLSYMVQVDNGSIMKCVVAQLRPLLDCNNVTRTPGPRAQRVIKPKQLFDL